MLDKIKKLTLELEEVISYEDTEDELEDNADFPDEKAMWLVKEEMLQTTLAQQLEHLCQDVFTLHQPQHGNLNCKYLYFKNKGGGKGAALDVAVRTLVHSRSLHGTAPYTLSICTTTLSNDM